MVSEAILGAIVGGLAAVGGAFVQAWFNRKNTQDRIQADYKNKRVENILAKEMEAIWNAIEAIHDINSQIFRITNTGGPTLSDSEIAEEINDSFEDLQKAFPFVSTKTNKDITEFIQSTQNFADLRRDDQLSEYDMDEHKEVAAQVLRSLHKELEGPLAEFTDASKTNTEWYGYFENR